MQALSRYDWPGNIRELQNLIERAVILSPGPTLVVPIEALTRGRRVSRRHRRRRRRRRRNARETDRRHILAALQASNWVLAGPGGAAARLGMKRSTLQFRMRKLGHRAPRPPDQLTERCADRAQLPVHARWHLPAAGSQPVGTAVRRGRVRSVTTRTGVTTLARSTATRATPARSSLYGGRPCSGSPSTPTRIDWC